MSQVSAWWVWDCGGSCAQVATYRRHSPIILIAMSTIPTDLKWFSSVWKQNLIILLFSGGGWSKQGLPSGKWRADQWPLLEKELLLIWFIFWPRLRSECLVFQIMIVTNFPAYCGCWLVRIVFIRSHKLYICRFRDAGWKIFYTDETWVNKNHAKTHMWRRASAASGPSHFLYEGGMELPSGEGERLIVVHTS